MRPSLDRPGDDEERPERRGQVEGRPVDLGSQQHEDDASEEDRRMASPPHPTLEESRHHPRTKAQIIVGNVLM